MPQNIFSSESKILKALTKLLIVFALFTSPLQAAPNQPTLTIGQLAPDFTLQDVNGTMHTLSKYRGKTVVLEWTNPSCPFVVRHYKKQTMQNTAKQFPNIVWLTINSSHFFNAKSSDGTEWAKKEGVKVLLDDHNGTTGKAYGARTTPHMFIVNPKGILIYQGAIDDDPYGDKEKPLNYIIAALSALNKGDKIKEPFQAPYGCSVKYAR